MRPYGRGISRSDAAEHSVRCLRELLSRVGFGNLLCICSFSLWTRALWLVCNIQLVDYQYVLYPKGGQGGRLNARLQVWMRGAAGDVQQWSEKKGRSPCNGACWCHGLYCVLYRKPSGVWWCHVLKILCWKPVHFFIFFRRFKQIQVGGRTQWN